LKAALTRKRQEEKKIEDPEGRKGRIQEMMTEVHCRKNQRNLKVLIEFCCDQDSMMTEMYKEQEGGAAFRFGLPKYDLLVYYNILLLDEFIKELVKENYTPIVWGSVPCNPRCSWQRVNCATIEHHAEKLGKQRTESLQLVTHFEFLVKRGQYKDLPKNKRPKFYFEWPKHNEGDWKTR
jgi:hypothetical protein